ncbi:MAG TPA: rhodanese-like domain-containing protein [Kofleriaceae bacterium]|nr:rhodanese-like domain-containing protein [Kofleriaceae bacterium]
MKSIAIGLSLALALATAATGCSKKDDKAASEKQSKVPTVSVGELETMLAKGACTPVDANGPETRKNRGVIPGAIRLSDYETFSAAELPADKARALVFYCANEQCGASHEAAEKALATGHKDVRVLTAGIKGWVDAGKRVEPGA